MMMFLIKKSSELPENLNLSFGSNQVETGVDRN